ncbi:MAG: hypothetical protein HYT80_07755 [Euryarchaeota archaeon]|nr:hypothetical protein [Euryarchaeota archaeon]
MEAQDFPADVYAAYAELERVNAYKKRLIELRVGAAYLAMGIPFLVMGAFLLSFEYLQKRQDSAWFLIGAIAALVVLIVAMVLWQNRGVPITMDKIFPVPPRIQLAIGGAWTLFFVAVIVLDVTFSGNLVLRVGAWTMFPGLLGSLFLAQGWIQRDAFHAFIGTILVGLSVALFWIAVDVIASSGIALAGIGICLTLVGLLRRSFSPREGAR